MPPISFQKEEAAFRKCGGTLRMTEALKAGVGRRALYAMRDQGLIEPISRGVYRLASLPAPEWPDLLAVGVRVPNGVICLLSALAFHELTTQVPHAVDVALQRGCEPPRLDHPPLNVHWFSGSGFTEGVETHALDGRSVRVYSAEKSVADAFKFRHQIGLDVAIEALREWAGRRQRPVEALLKQARHCRVEKVMRPYLQAITL